jgi:hypothetical protein
MKCPDQKGKCSDSAYKTEDNFSLSMDNYMKPNYSNGVTLLVFERRVSTSPPPP